MNFNAEALYYNDAFQLFLDRQTYKKGIRDREDFKHDVFAEILASESETIAQCKAAAQRVARQYQRDVRNDVALVDRSVVI